MGILRIYQVGEKFQAWTDVDPTMDDLLTNLTLWWLTDTYSTSIYPYQHVRKCVLTFVTCTDSTRLPLLAQHRVSLGPKVGQSLKSIEAVHFRETASLPAQYISKPTGFSSFTKQIAPTPRRWASQLCDLVSYRYQAKVRPSAVKQSEYH